MPVPTESGLEERVGERIPRRIRALNPRTFEAPESSPSPPLEERAGERRPFPVRRGDGFVERRSFLSGALEFGAACFLYARNGSRLSQFDFGNAKIDVRRG